MKKEIYTKLTYSSSFLKSGPSIQSLKEMKKFQIYKISPKTFEGIKLVFGFGF